MTTAHATPLPAPSTVPQDSSQWPRHAACVGADPELFAPTGNPSRARLVELRLTAIGHCTRCPVITACGADADRHTYEGLWGGAYRYRDHTSGQYVATPLIPAAPTSRPRKDRHR